jgi:hypothetical protein
MTTTFSYILLDVQDKKPIQTSSVLFWTVCNCAHTHLLLVTDCGFITCNNALLIAVPYCTETSLHASYLQDVTPVGTQLCNCTVCLHKCLVIAIHSPETSWRSLWVWITTQPSELHGDPSGQCQLSAVAPTHHDTPTGGIDPRTPACMPHCSKEPVYTPSNCETVHKLDVFTGTPAHQLNRLCPC